MSLLHSMPYTHGISHRSYPCNFSSVINLITIHINERIEFIFILIAVITQVHRRSNSLIKLYMHLSEADPETELNLGGSSLRLFSVCGFDPKKDKQIHNE